MRASTLILLSAPLLLAACVAGSGGGIGGTLGTGKPAGTVCDPNVNGQGCLGADRMQCDAATGKWTVLSTCPAGQACIEKVDPADALKRLATCQVASQPVPDSSSAQDATGGDTPPQPQDVQVPDMALQDVAGPDTAGPDAAGPDTAGPDTSTPDITAPDVAPDVPKPVKFSECVSKNCTQLWMDCGGEQACIEALDCADACAGNSSCIVGCAQAGGESPVIVELFNCGNLYLCGGGSVATCGNGKCDPGESPAACPSDCKAVCGDGKCSAGETPGNCAKDCGGATCGNSVCEEPAETATNCPFDCKSACGNGKCESGETPSNCAKDCTGTACCQGKGAQCGFVAGCPDFCGNCPSTATCSSNKCVPKATASCAGKCGTTQATCSCTATCKQAGNCCPDYDAQCVTGDCFQTSCGSEIQACDSDPGCVGLYLYAMVQACGKENNCQDSACGKTYCSTEIGDCQASPGCVALAQCLGKCQDQACADKCLPVSGAAKYDAMTQCYIDNCDTP